MTNAQQTRLTELRDEIDEKATLLDLGVYGNALAIGRLARKWRDAITAILAVPQAETPQPHDGCSLDAHFWLMGNVCIGTEPTEDKRCQCDRVAWKDRKKLLEVRTGYKTVYGTVELTPAALAASREPQEPTPQPSAVEDMRLPWRYDTLAEKMFDAYGYEVADFGGTPANRQDRAARWIESLANSRLAASREQPSGLNTTDADEDERVRVREAGIGRELPANYMERFK